MQKTRARRALVGTLIATAGLSGAALATAAALDSANPAPPSVAVVRGEQVAAAPSGTTLAQVAPSRAAGSVSPASTIGAPPRNPALADSAWPIFHANTYAQASVAGRGVEPGDQVDVQFLPTPNGRVSSYTILSPAFPDGRQAAYGSSNSHVFKAVLDGERFSMASALDMDRGRWAFDFNLFMLADGRIVTTDKRRNEIVFVGEEDRRDPYSPLRILKRVRIPREAGDMSTHISIAYDGTILFITRDSVLGAYDDASGQFTLFDLSSAEGDLGVHNAFAVDERGHIYLVSEQAMTRVDWDGRSFRLAWRAPYDFKGPGCDGVRRGRIRQVIAVARGQRCTGSGTTPTLIGSPDSGVVVVNDGHSPANNAVAFWRGEPPAGWRGLPGRDSRVAGVLALPYSSPDGAGFTNENSPAAAGNGFASAQWNGFRPSCDPLRGVQKVEWDPASRSLRLAWATDAVNMNGVLGLAAGSGLVYQTGRRDCIYRLYGLDWRTGALRVDIPLGDDPRFLDQGNSIVPAADRSLLFGTARGLVRVRPRG